MDNSGGNCILNPALGAETVAIGAFHNYRIKNKGKDDERISWTTIRIHITAAIHIRTIMTEAVTAGAAEVEVGAEATGEKAAATDTSAKAPRH
jgi:hypothetical protein